MASLRPKTARSLLLLLLAAAPSPTLADAIVRSDAVRADTIAELFVERDGVTVELEIGGRDLPAFRNLLPDEIYEMMGNAPRPLAERTRAFFEQELPIAEPGGAPLAAAVLEIGPRARVLRDRVTGEPLPAEEGVEPEMTVFARLFYPFPAPPAARPEKLTFSAPAGSSTGFVLYHRGIAVNDFRYLGPSVILELDWSDPFYSRFESRSLRRQYFAPMSGFLYVEPYEVRKEVIVRPLDLQPWVDLGLEGRETIPVEAQPELERRVAAFLRDHMPVEIDGARIEPELARIHFLERTLRTSRVVDPRRELSVYGAVLGVIFVYPTDGLPQRVTMDWDLWSDRLTQIPASAVDQAGALPTLLEPDWRTLEWENFLRNPELPTLVAVRPPPRAWARAASWLSWGLAGMALVAIAWAARGPRTRVLLPVGLAGLAALAFVGAREARVDDARAREVVAALLHNVYRAFDYRDEERIYDVLAQSAAGDLLEQIYLETRRGLVLASQGGARAKVKSTELVDLAAEPAADGAFRADVTWDVSGSVGHWGHIHQRANRVRAEIVVAPIEGTWKLVALDVVEEERI